MVVSILPLPDEPRSLKTLVRALLEQAPDEGLPLVLAGGWIADPLWERWREALERRGVDRQQFDQIVAGYGNELRLWVVGERPWEQVVSGLAGRIARRLTPAPVVSTGNEAGSRACWQKALARVGIGSEAELSALVSRIGELHLLYEIAAPRAREEQTHADGAPAAIVWAGARPRDPEAPCGESRSGMTGAAALAEALGRFLLKDPAYPPR